jgi:predicted PurR-regulated permease PerM
MPSAAPNARDWGRLSQQSLVAIAIVLVIGSLHVAKSAVVPILFAIFLAMLLAPAVALVRRVGVPRAIAAGIVVISLVTVVGLGLNATWRPARDWLDAAPQTMRTLERKLRPITRFIAKVESVSEQAERVTDPSATKSGTQAPATTAGKKSTIANTQEWAIAILTTLMVTYFLLAAGPSLLMKIETTQGAREPNTRLLRVVTAISDDLSRYFATITLINLILGIATTVTMYWLGMPNPLLWGVVAFVLNYVPYAGSAATLVLLTVVAVVSFDGLGKALAVAGSYLVLTTVEGQVVQPILVGRRLDVSPLFVFLSLWFGGWLWGIAGVALAVPLLVAAKALRLELRASEEPTAAAQPGGRKSTVRSRAAELLAAGTAHLHARGDAGHRVVADHQAPGAPL